MAGGKKGRRNNDNHRGFNARTGEMEGRIVMEEGKEDDKNKNSKDKKMNKEGKKLVEILEEAGWSILNGNTKGDKKENIHIQKIKEIR